MSGMVEIQHVHLQLIFYLSPTIIKHSVIEGLKDKLTLYFHFNCIPCQFHVFPWSIKEEEMVKMSDSNPESILNGGRDICVQEIIMKSMGESP